MVNKTYGPVEGVGPVVSVTGVIRPGYGNVTAFDGDVFWEAAEPLLDSSKTVKFIEVRHANVPGYKVMVYYTDGTLTLITQSYESAEQLLAYGITAIDNPDSGTADYIDLTPVYGSGAKQIIDLYGSASGQTQRVTKVYGSGPETGYIITAASPAVIDIMAFTDMYYRTYGPFTFRPESIQIYAIGQTTRIYVSDWGLSTQVKLFSYPTGSYNGEGGAWGFSSEPVPVSSGSSLVASLTSSSSKSPLARLIHQGFGHLDYTPYGYITYYTDNTHTTTAVAPIRTQEELDGFANHSGGGDWSNTIDFGRVTVSTRGDHAIKMISFTDKTKTLGPYFLWGANYLDGEIVLPSSLTQIGTGFLYSCDSPNITVNVGNLSAAIGTELPSYPYFMSTSSSSYGSYTVGIKIAGANRAAWLTKFPNRDTDPYRKLVDAGY